MAEASRHSLPCGRTGSAQHLSWPSFTSVSRRRWSWRVLRCALPLANVSRCRIFNYKRIGEGSKTPLTCIGRKNDVLHHNYQKIFPQTEGLLVFLHFNNWSILLGLPLHLAYHLQILIQSLIHQSSNHLYKWSQVPVYGIRF